MQISVIIATFNDELSIAQSLEALSRLINVDEVVVVDGGSTDSTVKFVEKYDVGKSLKLVKMTEANRGRQFNEGARQASHEIFWFLRAGTRPLQGSARQIKSYLRFEEVAGGNFETAFEGENRWAHFLQRVYPYLKNSGLIYADPAPWTRRKTFEKMGGFRPLPVFESLDFLRRLPRRGRLIRLNQSVTVSAERFESRSLIRTFLKWAIFQGLYLIGLPPRILARYYR